MCPCPTLYDSSIFTTSGRECVPASVPVVENRSNSKEDKDKSTNDNMIMDNSISSSSDAYCHVTSDIPLPSGQSPVVKGIVHLHESVFWGLNVKVKMNDLPVPRGERGFQDLNIKIN